VRDVDNLLHNFLISDRTIILCIIPANQDIATVDILERASHVDPDGERTIGVLTKPDLVPEGSENSVMETVMNRLKPLKLGYVIVKNRNQEEVSEGSSLAAARASERNFFSSHEVCVSLVLNFFLNFFFSIQYRPHIYRCTQSNKNHA
jgi:interferon-induced GTP-binding protein Mx